MMGPRIVCAAAKDKLTHRIAIGIRHFDELMRAQMDRTPGPQWAQAEQGFIDQFGTFYTRQEAMELVKRNGQPFFIDRNGGDEALFSEGLY